VSTESIRLGVPRTWEVYLVVTIEVIAAYGLVAKLLPVAESFRLLAFGLVLGLLFTANEIVLAVDIMFAANEVRVRRLGHLGSRLHLPAERIVSVVVAREHDPVLKIQLNDGQSVQLGPWTRWNTKRRYRQLVAIKSQIEKHVNGSDERGRSA
jgi:hypothetical protein